MDLNRFFFVFDSSRCLSMLVGWLAGWLVGSVQLSSTFLVCMYAGIIVE